jgi:glycosyltransferase involved in cell wall biosynthesis
MSCLTPESACPPKAAPLAPVPLLPLAPQPLVSVIVPSYNQGRFIRATLDSILGQDYRPIEVLVIDGGSQDETIDVLKSYGELPELSWVSEKDRGVVHAVNKGFAKVRGGIIAIQSSDDCYLPTAISEAVAEFRRDPAVGLVYGDTIKVDAEGREVQRTTSGPYHALEDLFLLRTWIPQPSAFFRREMLDTLGGWDARIPYAPDTDLWIRMALRTKVRKIDQYLSQRRIHDQQRDTQTRKIVRDYTRMIEQSEDIRDSSLSIRRAARASKHLIRLRYNPTGSNWYAAWHLFLAGIADRRCSNLPEVARLLLYYPVRMRLSRIKRRLLGKSAAVSKSQNRTGRGGQAHFAHRASQHEPVPGSSGTDASLPENRK